MSSIIEALTALFRPLLLMSMSAYFLPHTILNLLKTGTIPTSWPSFKDHWFARFWVFFGPMSSTNISPVIKPLVAHAKGVVLDIGSGQGHLLRFYDSTNVTKLYAVEPNKAHHEHLVANAEKAGFVRGRNFEIIDSYIETLESEAGIKRGSIDTIITLMVLCSIPNPQVLIPELRSYLKPKGGRWIVCEHVRRPGSGEAIVARYQRMLNWVWPEFFNGCSLTRDTKAWIEGSGKWSVTEGDGRLKYLETDSEYAVIPSVTGWLVSEQ